MSEAINILNRILPRTRRMKNGCLICFLDLDKDDYSHFKITRRGKRYRVHRLMMHLVKDFDLDSEELILHNDDICEYKSCIEVDHLRSGTISENAHDSIKKWGNNRTGKFPLECKRGHKLTGDNVYPYEGHHYCKKCRHLSYLERNNKNV